MFTGWKITWHKSSFYRIALNLAAFLAGSLHTQHKTIKEIQHCYAEICFEQNPIFCHFARIQATATLSGFSQHATYMQYCFSHCPRGTRVCVSLSYSRMCCHLRWSLVATVPGGSRDNTHYSSPHKCCAHTHTAVSGRMRGEKLHTHTHTYSQDSKATKERAEKTGSKRKCSSFTQTANQIPTQNTFLN